MASYKENVDAYGINHIGAQRIIGAEIWQKHCPKFNQYNLLTKTHVNSEGSASNASIHDSKVVMKTKSVKKFKIMSVEDQRKSEKKKAEEPTKDEKDSKKTKAKKEFRHREDL